MKNLIQRILKGEKGFTLIELLVVVAIIGILVAIAIPQFASYKKNANDSAAQSDIRSMALAAEAYYAANNSYSPNAGNAAYTVTYTAPTQPAATDPLAIAGFAKISNGNTVIFTYAALSTAYSIVGSNSGGTGKIYTWDSGKGGMQ